MNIKFEDDKPIYKQLIEYLKIMIIKGEYKSGDKIPSVRELAVIIRTNPNTIQRALVELEKEKLIYTQRTLGKFVTDDENLIYQAKEKLAKEKIDRFLIDMNKMNITKEELLSFIKKEGS